ncbi:hypothetical protein UPYG_G00139830 [Umbra pygmaea]|uniref:Fibronectin type-III domain-containing protein n=1 Tax=Umbra pygmaea TaxID=75934 RepID=A0ABD0XK25_UMBPY
MLLLLTLVLLYSMNCLNGNYTTTGPKYSLDCVNDYLYTIYCSLSILPEETHTPQTSYWLVFMYSYIGAQSPKFHCVLTKMDDIYSCRLDTYKQAAVIDAGPFYDILTFNISLYHKGSDGHTSVTLLDEEYMPRKHIKPNAPFNLTVTRMSNQYCITWMSIYEDYLSINLLNEYLKYEVMFKQSGHNDKSLEVRNTTILSVSDDYFEPHTEYSVKVRCIPNQVHYKGQWSEWTPATRWKTDAIRLVAELPKNTPFSAMFCLLIPVMIILCSIPIIRLKKNTFIPTPATYFESLYSNCDGDFQSWVVTPDYNAELLKTEETLRIDILTEASTVLEASTLQGQDHVFQECPVNNLSKPTAEAFFFGLPYAVSLGPPLRAPRSPLQSLSLSEPESNIEVDSGCWLHSTGSLEQESAWYRNELNNRDYCMLSDMLVFSKTSETVTDTWHSGSLFSEVMYDGEHKVEPLNIN